ncbi:WXG100 family type VII secretion target [Streptomyces sp. NPDC057638]|uniref:WXG100 family type VII secretion target n=1 Tax=Streptomyces sp. NPDC057638 TaxID=3346190 RepID=UPI00367F87E9
MGKPSKGSTPFESMTQEQLFALLTPVNKTTAETVAQRLKSAAAVLKDIGDDLKVRVALVRWEGEGADAFKDWAGQTANATLRLGDYSEQAGKWMDDVVQAITEARTGLDDLMKSASSAESSFGTAKSTHFAAVHDPDAPKNAASDARDDMDLARADMESARLASVDKLRKLSQTYTQSGEQINKLEPPTFPPPASLLGDRWRENQSSRGYGQYESYGGGGGTGGTSYGAPYGTPQPRAMEPAGVVRPPQDGGPHAIPGETPPTVVTPVSPAGPVPNRPEPTVDLGIDSVMVPEAPTAPAPGPASPGARPDGGGPVPAGPVPGPVSPVGIGGGGGTVGGKPVPQGKGVVPAGQGGGTVAPRAPMGPRPEGGIVGGRPVPQAPGGPGGGRTPGVIPRGTVIGAEGTTGMRGQVGRGPVGTPGMYGGAPVGGGAQGGVYGGRRLASETGGVVGARAPQQPGIAVGRPFTPGGSGLVRGNEAGQTGRAGMAGAAANTPTARRDEEERGERPDYLTEDEETWQQRNRKIVPPVID